MANYKQARTSTGEVTDKIVINLDTGASIPNDPANTDWQEFQRYMEDGGDIEDADPVPPPSESEVARQLLAAVDWTKEISEIRKGLQVLTTLKTETNVVKLRDTYNVLFTEIIKNQEQLGTLIYRMLQADSKTTQ